MAHEHEWEPFNVTTSFSLQFVRVDFCKGCRTFLCFNADGTSQEVT
jgi:hypothetical protein